MKQLSVEVWSDIACPWCYVGKRRLETALAGLPFRDSVEVVWRAFELDPSAAPSSTTTPPVPYAARLAKKYGMSTAAAEKRIQQLTDVAAADGLEMRFDRAKPGNTFDAHRLLHLAAAHGLQNTLKERLFRAYLTDGEAISDHAVLERLATEVGLDAAEIRSVLSTDAYAAEVRADEDQARALDITGVPFFAIAGRYGVPGAQPAEMLAGALTQAWNELPEAPSETLAEGAICGPAGCD